MRVGLCFDGFYSIQEMIELARLADEIGMESIWMSDHLCFRDSLTTCMALAGVDEDDQSCAGADEPVFAQSDYFGDVGRDHGRICPGPRDRESRHRQCRGVERSRHRIAASAANHARVRRNSPPLAKGRYGAISGQDVSNERRQDGLRAGEADPDVHHRGALAHAPARRRDRRRRVALCRLCAGLHQKMRRRHRRRCRESQ